MSGSEEESRAAELLEARYERMGYDTEIQHFDVRRFDFARWYQSGGANAVAIVESPREIRFSGLPLTNSPNYTTASGPLMTLDLSESDVLPTDGLEGKIVHALTGDLQLDESQVIHRLRDQVNSLAAKGAVAVLFSRKLGEPSPYRPVYGTGSPIPALLLPKVDGMKLYDLTEEGEVILTVKIDVYVLESQNVIAEMRGAGDDVVVVGAHYDIVPQTESGANDNASGTAVLLSLAKALSGRSLPFTVRFVSFGAEELGLFGSLHYVASLSDPELRRLKAMLNIDVPSSGEYTALSGHQKLTEAALVLANDLGVEARTDSMPSGASSDHEPFQNAGVPVLVLWAPDFSRIHTPADTLDFIQPERLAGAFLVAKALLESPEFTR